MRALVPFTVTVMAVCLLAPILGTLVVGGLSGNPFLVVARDLAGVPVLFHALMASLPVALPASVCAALAATVFGYTMGRRLPYWVWVVVFSTLGIVLGTLCALPLIVAHAQAVDYAMASFWILLGSVCGLCLLAALSGLWYLFFKIN